MRKIIAVELKEESIVPRIDCVALNNAKLIEHICYVEMDEPLKLYEITVDEFLNGLQEAGEAQEYLDSLDKYSLLDYGTKEIESAKELADSLYINITTDRMQADETNVKVWRTYLGTMLFKKSQSSVFLGKAKKRDFTDGMVHNATYGYYSYFWHNGNYFTVKNVTGTGGKERVYMEHEGYLRDKLVVTDAVYELFEDKDIAKKVYKLAYFLIRYYGLNLADVQNMLTELFNYTSKTKQLKMNRRKIRSVLGIDANGLSGKAENFTMENYTKIMSELGDTEDTKVDSSLLQIVSGAENITKCNSVVKAECVDCIQATVDSVKNQLRLKETREFILYKSFYDEASGKMHHAKSIGAKAKEYVDIMTEEVNKQEFERGDENCSYCHGEGFRYIDMFGEKIKAKCECVNRLRKIKHAKEDSTAGVIKIGGRALSTTAMMQGLIPRRRVNDLLDMRVMGDRISEICQENGEKIIVDEFDRYKVEIKNVLALLLYGRDLDYSIMFSAPNSFSKTTFVYTCFKLLLNKNKKVVPFISLFELAQLRLEEMNEMTWRKGKGFKTATQDKIIYNGSYGGKVGVREKVEAVTVEDEQDEERAFIDMSDREKDDYIARVQSEEYTYKDYLKADVLFCQMSVVEQSYVEISELKSLMDYRGLKGLPTIIITDRNVEAYKTSLGMATDVTLLNDMLTTEHKFATYDRALLVSVKKVRNGNIREKKGETL